MVSSLQDVDELYPRKSDVPTFFPVNSSGGRGKGRQLPSIFDVRLPKEVTQSLNRLSRGRGRAQTLRDNMAIFSSGAYKPVTPFDPASGQERTFDSHPNPFADLVEEDVYRSPFATSIPSPKEAKQLPSRLERKPSQMPDLKCSNDFPALPSSRKGEGVCKQESGLKLTPTPKSKSKPTLTPKPTPTSKSKSTPTSKPKSTPTYKSKSTPTTKSKSTLTLKSKSIPTHIPVSEPDIKPTSPSTTSTSESKSTLTPISKSIPTHIPVLEPDIKPTPPSTTPTSESKSKPTLTTVVTVKSDPLNDDILLLEQDQPASEDSPSSTSVELADARTVCIKNLPTKITSTDISDIVSPCGQIENISTTLYIADGKSSLVANVRMIDADSAEYVVSILNEAEYMFPNIGSHEPLICYVYGDE